MKGTRLFRLGLTFFIAACADDPAGPPATQLVMAKPFEHATVGARINAVARVADESGAPVAGAVVTFGVNEGTTPISTAERRTDGNGVAVLGLQLPTRATLIVISAQLDGSAQDYWRIRASAGPPAVIALAEDTLWLTMGQSETLLPEMTDRYGNWTAGGLLWQSADTTVALFDDSNPIEPRVLAVRPGRTLLRVRATFHDFDLPLPTDSIVVVVNP